ncbi:MAG: GNAT family N-acetyltransferase [Proteobacteria bacterium]|nr:GNAT family N-acetyltransferase [Pseudomonadota bacterium]MBI3500020.1 GNAT family N-acetyltransferase [Pseudomonadota bacterium]
MVTIEVRDTVMADRPAWQRMWSANCKHFGASIPEADDHELWRRLMDPANPVGSLVASASDSEGLLVGFAHYVLHPHTFSRRMVCYLEDLWVEPAARGAGIGRRLIEALIARGRDLGWQRLYWHTAADNAAARALYDRIARATNHVRYDITLR